MRLIWLLGTYKTISIIILNINHWPVFYLKHDVLATRVCLRLRVDPTQLGLVDRANLCLWTPATLLDTTE
jgi:hypothetical protein